MIGTQPPMSPIPDRCIQPVNLYPVTFRNTAILSFHLTLRFQNELFTADFTVKLF